ncbi:MAG: hypothetical protein WBG32_05065 [Nodosilinea sp.]
MKASINPVAKQRHFSGFGRERYSHYCFCYAWEQPQWLGDYFLQIAAYRQAAMQVYADLGLEVQKGLIAIALADQRAQLFEVAIAEMEDHWRQFEQRL